MNKIFSLLIASFLVAKAFGQVELQTGNAVFGLSIFSWQDDKSRLQAQAGLQYSSGGGLKVDAISSNIGQGWDLQAGGLISRMQIGEPDDQLGNEGTGLTSDNNKYPPGYLYNPVDASQGCPNGLGYYPIFGAANTVYGQHNSILADREQDYFNVQMNGRSVMFVLGKNNGDSGRTLGSSRLRIWFHRDETGMANRHIRTTIDAFYIQDESGLIYAFTELGITKVLRAHASLPNPLAGPQPQPQFADGGVYCESYFDEIPVSYNPNVVTSWHLTSITDPLTQRAITFSYTVRNLNNFVGNNIGACWDGGDLSGGTIPAKTYIQITRNISITQSPCLTSIQCPDGRRLDFNYDLDNPRADLAGDFPMQSVTHSYNGRIVSGFILSTTYFMLNHLGMPQTDVQREEARLCLRSITKIGLDGVETQAPYIFDYFMGTIGSADDFVPPPFYYTKDIYGYYNGNQASALINNSPSIPILTDGLTGNMTADEYFRLSFKQLKALCFLGFNPNPAGFVYNYNTIKPQYAQNGLLKTITYPSAGTLTYQYEQNAYNKMLDKHTVTQESSSSARFNNSNYVGGVHVSQISQTDGGYSNSSSNPMVTTYKYTDPTGSFTSQWGHEDPNNIVIENYNFHVEGSHPRFPSGCSYDFAYPGIANKDQFYSANDNQKTLQTAMMVAGVATTAYGITSDLGLYSGAANPALLLYDVLTTLGDFYFQNCDNGAQQGFVVHYYNSNLRAQNSLPAQFSRVEVTVGGMSGGIGKTVHEFTDFNDYEIWDDVNTLNPNLATRKQRAAFWTYGLPKITTVLDDQGRKVKQTTNVYDFANARQPATASTSCNCQVGVVNSLRSDSWTAMSSTANLTYSTTTYETQGQLGISLSVSADPYQLYTGRSDLTDTYDRDFQQGDDTRFLETHSHFTYDVNNFRPQKTIVYASNGDEKIKETYYSCDYTAPAVLQTMSADNIIMEEVASYSSIIHKNSSTPMYVSANVSQFSVIPTGDIRNTGVYEGRSTQPISGWVFDESSPNNYPNLVGSRFRKFDELGRMTRTQDEAGRTMTNIYDYSDKIIAATVYNADPDTDPSAYTSFETSSAGGWTINGTPSYSTVSITGARGFNLNDRTLRPNSISVDWTFNKPYVLSFWAYQFADVEIGSALTLAKTGPTKNGFTYYEYAVPAGTEGVGIHGNGAIDELRLYPAGARMLSGTYDPLIGKTSDCDLNNRITYYEYDALGRLRFVRDENKNILKMYEYNAKQPGLVGTSKVVAYTGPVYVRLTVENETSDENGNEYADLIAHVYSDPAGTNPVWVNNLQLNAITSGECDNGGPLGSSPSNFNPISGSVVKLISQGQILQITIGQDQAGNNFPINCVTTYSLLPGSGYNVLQN
jgi:hypothetical protein